MHSRSFVLTAASLRDFSYVGEHGDIHRIFHYGGKWGQEALNNAGASSAPPAAGGPWIRQASGSGGEVLQVFYLDGEGNLQHLSGPQGKWSSEVVNTGAHVTMAPPAGGLVFY